MKRLIWRAWLWLGFSWHREIVRSHGEDGFLVIDEMGPWKAGW